MRTREPPAIFQPSAMMIYNPLKALQQKFYNMAYKHPQLLIGDEKDECDKIESPTTPIAVASCCDNNGATTGENYGNANQHNDYEERSAIKLNICNGGSQQMSEERSGVLNTNCHLIGNVKPNLIKTWERLNGMPSKAQPPGCHQNGSNDNGHQQPQPLTPQCDTYINPSIYLNSKYHLFPNQPMANLPPKNNDESFVIRRLPSKSGYFYDSIEVETQDDEDEDDDDDDVVVDEVDEQEVIASLCDELEHGGEGMAEYISLMEKKEKHCWSMDSNCNWYGAAIFFTQKDPHACTHLFYTQLYWNWRMRKIAKWWTHTKYIVLTWLFFEWYQFILIWFD